MGSNYGVLKATPGVNAYLEARTNLKDTPWDLGFQLGLGYMNRKANTRLHIMSAINSVCLLLLIIISGIGTK